MVVQAAAVLAIAQIHVAIAARRKRRHICHVKAIILQKERDVMRIQEAWERKKRIQVGDE